MRMITLGLALLTTPALATQAQAAPASPCRRSHPDQFDTETLEVAGTMDVSGVEKLHGIDFRPADGMLYGVAAVFSVVTIDTSTGAATVKSQLSEQLPDGVSAIVDFNPVADRLRLMGSDGTNLRANVDDGVVTVDGSWPSKMATCRRANPGHRCGRLHQFRGQARSDEAVQHRCHYRRTYPANQAQ